MLVCEISQICPCEHRIRYNESQICHECVHFLIALVIHCRRISTTFSVLQQHFKISFRCSNDNLGSILMLINLSRSNASMTYVSLSCLQNTIPHIVFFGPTLKYIKLISSVKVCIHFFGTLSISTELKFCIISIFKDQNTNYLAFKEPGGSLPPLHKLAIGPYLQKDLYIFHLPQIHFNIVLPSTPWPPYN